MKDKTHMIILEDAKEEPNKIQHSFYDKNSQESGYRGNTPQHNYAHV